MNEEILFHEALTKTDPRERMAFLDAACAGQPELRSAVEALLAASDPSTSFLDRPAVERLPSDIGVLSVTEGRGSVIGPYKLIKQIGEGGFGIVYLAEQQEPMRREVALKTIKPGMDTRQVVARFESERQALALMDHPNIARVLDGGQTNSGRPYFVMELVKGIPITKYCDEHQLTPRERLALFVPICQAIQHAHQKGLIHRDLKPTNVLIAEQDGVPMPKVIDFGVAKALSSTAAELLAQSAITGLGRIVGTLEYMSPEQAEFSAPDIDTRADIYSLGVLMYELITGTTPLTKEQLTQAAVTELLRVIREDEPPYPSTRLTDSKEVLASISARRNLEPARLTKSVRGELDWIVMKCLEKDRDRRYATANGLARDIERYLNDEPVEAGPPSATYRLRKLARKHRTLLGTAFSFVLLLAVAAVGGTWLAVRATRGERIAAQKAAIAKAVNDFLQRDLLGQANIENQPAGLPRNRNITVRELVDRSAEGIDSRFRGQGLTEAAIRLTLGQTYRSLGEYADAERYLQRSLELRKAILGPRHPDTLESMSHLAHLHLELKQYDQAGALYQTVRDTLQDQFGDGHPETLQSIRNLAKWHATRGDYERAEVLYQQALAGFRSRYGADHIDTLATMQHLGELYDSLARYDEASSLMQQVIDLRVRRLGRDHPETLHSQARLARIRARQGEDKRAEKIYLEVLGSLRSAQGNDHPSTLQLLTELALYYRDRGRYQEAEPLLQEALSSYCARGGDQDDDTLNAMNNLAGLYRDQGRLQDAAPLFEEVVQGLTANRGANDRWTLISMNNLAMLYQSTGQLDKAAPLLKRTLARCRNTLGPHDMLTLTCLSNLGGLYLDRKRYDDAEPLFREVLEIRRRQLGPNHVDTLISMNQVALVLSGREQFSEAELLFKKVIDGRQAALGPDHPDLLRTMNNLAIVYRDSERPDEAAELFQQVLDARRQKLGEEHPDTLVTLYNFALLDQDRGRLDSAAMMLGSAVRGAVKQLGPTHPQTQRFIDAYARLSGILLEQKKYTEAERAARECLEFRTQQQPGAWTTYDTLGVLGAALLGQNKFAEAEPFLLKGYQGMERRAADMPDEDKHRIQSCLDGLIQLYDAWGKPDEAAKWRATPSTSGTMEETAPEDRNKPNEQSP